jgi:hypothetical protein
MKRIEVELNEEQEEHLDWLARQLQIPPSDVLRLAAQRLDLEQVKLWQIQRKRGWYRDQLYDDKWPRPDSFW